MARFMPERRRRRQYDTAVALYRAGSLMEASALAAQVEHELGATPASAQGRTLLGLTRELSAFIHLDRGMTQDALEAFLAAETAFRLDEGNSELAGRVSFQIASLSEDLGLRDVAQSYRDRASENLHSTPSARYLASAETRRAIRQTADWRERLTRLHQEIETGREQLAAIDSVPKRRSSANDSTDDQDVVVRRLLGLQSDVAELLVLNGDAHEVQDGLLQFAALALTLADADPNMFLQFCYPLGFLIDHPEINMSAALAELVPAAFEVARPAQSHEHLAQAHFLAALLARQRHALPEAAEHAVTAIAAAEIGIAENESVAIRSALRHRLDERRDLALATLIELGDGSGAAELIEASRLQSVPAPRTARSRDSSSSDVLSAALEISRVSLAGLASVTIGGRSLIGSARQSLPVAARLSPSVSVPSLESAIAAVGGPAAWWWGGWAALGRYHWAVRTPAGEWMAGTHVIDDRQAAAIAEFEQYYSHADEQRQATGVPWTDFTREQRLSCEIGSFLIPSPLIGALLAGPPDTSLVVAGNLVSAVCLPTLCLDITTGIRLIERAVLRIQPPAAITGLIAPRQASHCSSWPLLVACTDPDGELEYSRHEDLACGIRLSGTAWNPPGGQARPATVGNLRVAMAALRPGTQGIFFYSGHVDQLGFQNDASVSLKLADGYVSAAEWFGITEDRRLFAPSRVIISGCTSSGSPGAGAGEWLGLGAAFLSAGARQVVATSWPIPDSPSTQRFERKLIEQLESHADVAKALSEIQREALRKWRSEANTWSSFDEQHSSPVTWAAYQAMGVLE